MKRKTKDVEPQFVVCIRNKDCGDLEVRKIYQVLPDKAAAEDGYIRVIDESGEDYLYPASYFFQSSCRKRWEKNCSRRHNSPTPPPNMSSDWAQLIFTEKVSIRWRSDFKSDGAAQFHEGESGLNQGRLAISQVVATHACRLQFNVPFLPSHQFLIDNV